MRTSTKNLRALTLAMTGLALIAGPLAAPAAAHPLTGGPATTEQIWVTAVGIVVTLIGVGMALAASRDSEKIAANRNLFRKGGLTIAAVGLLGFVVGPDLVGPSGACDERPTTGANLTIVRPEANETFDSTEIPVEVDIEGGIITDAATIENVEGEGHIHISIDGKLTSMTGEEEQTIEVEPGEHEIEVEYVANDHAPFCTRVVKRAQFTAGSEGSG